MHHGNYLKKYISQMTKTMSKMFPDMDKEEIKKVVSEMVDESCTSPEVTLDNNQTGEVRDTQLLSVLDWMLEREPIIAGNGTFYVNQYEGYNPIAKMLEGFLTKRKELKKIMFQQDPGSDEYVFYDRSQVNQKINANS